MSSEFTSISTEGINSKPKKIKIKKNNLKIKIKEKKHCQESDTNIDSFNKWSDKSKDIPFKSSKKCVGNGEEKLAKELDISTQLGGQNSTVDLVDPVIGKISVKDMTKDDCRLGTDCKKKTRGIMRNTVGRLKNAIEKYKDTDSYAMQLYDDLNKTWGFARTTPWIGIDSYELSNKNFLKVNELLETLKPKYAEANSDFTRSEYVGDICAFLKDTTLIEKINECVRTTEAILLTLIIVHKQKGWMIVKDSRFFRK